METNYVHALKLPSLAGDLGMAEHVQALVGWSNSCYQSISSSPILNSCFLYRKQYKVAYG
jgi:hypothetical protein